MSKFNNTRVRNLHSAIEAESWTYRGSAPTADHLPSQRLLAADLSGLNNTPVQSPSCRALGRSGGI